MTELEARPAEDAGNPFQAFQNLMPYRVHDILLVSSLYDSFTLQEDGRLNDVTLGADQEIDGLPCLGGTLVWFHPNQRVSSLHLASDRDVDGIPCAGGKDLLLALNFHPNGCLAGATLSREHVLIGRRFPRRTHVSFDGSSVAT